MRGWGGGGGGGGRQVGDVPPQIINAQTATGESDGWIVCTRCMRMGEKLHKLKEDRRETQNQLRELACRPFSFSIAHRMPKAKWRNE